jgi:hypothetical protein
MRRPAIPAVLLLAMAAAPASAVKKPEEAGAIVKGKDEDAILVIMRGFTKALGVKCNYCHVKEEGKFDYPQWTKRKRIALWMHLQFVQKLKQADGTEVTCNTCHQGKRKILRRALK